MIISSEDIEKIQKANLYVSGTKDYQKYHMCMEYKYKKDGRWSSWKFLGYGVPSRQNMQFSLKTIKDKTYLISEEYTDSFGYIYVERYGVTDNIKQLLGLQA